MNKLFGVIANEYGHPIKWSVAQCRSCCPQASPFLARICGSMVSPGWGPVQHQGDQQQHHQVLLLCGFIVPGSSLIQAPPAYEPYEFLKAWLVKTYALNAYQKFESVISLPLSGDQKPSHLMNRMLALVPEDFKPGFIFQGLFLRRLPAEVRAHLLQEDIADPRALSLKADKLYHSLVSSSVNVLSSEETLDPQIVNAVRGSSSASRGRRSSVSSTLSSATTSRCPASSLCWYHRSHRENALNCCKPCSWSGN